MLYTRVDGDWVRNTEGEVASFQATGRALVESTTAPEAVAIIDPDSLLVRLDGNGNLAAGAFISGYTPTATAAATLTLTADSNRYQELTGTTTEIVLLPRTDIVAGRDFLFINNSTGVVTVNANNGTTVQTVNPGNAIIVVAKIDAPNQNNQWSCYTWLNAQSSGGSATANAIAVRTNEGNLIAGVFIPSLASTTTSAGSLALTIASAQDQRFTGTTTHTVVLPTTSVRAGHWHRLINNSTGVVTVNSSAGNLVTMLPAGGSADVTALIATPTAATDWQVVTGTASSSADASTLALRDSSANIKADAFIPGFTTTVTAAGTTTLTVDSTEEQEFTGTTTQAVLLPTTGVAAGHRFTVINSSTGGVTVQSSGANTLLFVNGGFSATFIAKVATPTTAAHWQVISQPNINSSSAATATTLAQRNSAGNLALNSALFSGLTTTSSAGTLTMAVGHARKQVIIGSTTHTYTLPTTGVAIYQDWEFINTSSGAVTINSSGGNLVKTLAAGASTVVTALQATPTTAAHWFAS